MNDPIELDVVARWSLYRPQEVVLVDADGERTWTWKELQLQVHRLAGFLEIEGVRRGDRVAALAGNDVEYVALFLALQRLGAALVPINFRLAVREVQHILDDAAPRLFFSHAAYASTVAQLKLPTGLRHLRFEGLAEAMVDGMSPRFEHFESRFDDACMILYTSGTTGAPKGALITNAMVFWNSVSTGLRLDLTQHDVTLSFLPMFHTSGWHVLNTPFLHRGARMIFLRKFDPARVLQLIEQHGITVLFGVPTTLASMAQQPGFASTSLSSVRFAIVGGEPMSLELIRTWHGRGVKVRQGFGLTEFGPNVFSLQEEHAELKMGSIGFPNFYCDVKLVDDAGREVGVDEVGELLLRGPACTPGYWKNDAATAEAIRDGWFHTGDLVRRDADGFFFVAGRKKDMFISGGENVYPAEVERVLSTHPKLREVAVIGVKDAKWGEVGKAVVSLVAGAQLTLDELQAFCDGKLARYKIPRHLQVLPELPKTDSGKILKRALKDPVVS